MSRTVHPNVPVADRGTNRKLAFGVLATPLAWFINEIAGVAIVGRDCAPGDSPSSVHWIAIGLVTLCALGIAIAGVITSWRVLHSRHSAVFKAEGWNRVEFIALFGLFVSALLLLNMIFFGVMPLVVEPCMTAI